MEERDFNKKLQQLLNHFNINHQQGGCSLSVYHQGVLVSQISCGIARIDPITQQTTAWQPNTLSLNFSTGKGVVSTLIHILVSSGILSYDQPIAEYWKAFAQYGKKDICLRDVLSHQTDLFAIIDVVQHIDEMLDWQEMLLKVEKMHSSLPKRSMVAYNALVWGWILGGLIEQATKKSFSQVLQQYLIEPLGLQNQLFIGMPNEFLGKVALPIGRKILRQKPTLIQDNQQTLSFYQSLPFYPQWQAILAQRFGQDDQQHLTTQKINQLYLQDNQMDLQCYRAALMPVGSRDFNYYADRSLQAVMPAVNCVASSLALAKVYAMLSLGGRWQDKVLIQPDVFAELSKIHNDQSDKVMPANMQWRLGFHRVFSLCHLVDDGFGHMGYNGSMAWCDPSRELAVAFVHNFDVTMMTDIRQFIINEVVLDYVNHLKIA